MKENLINAFSSFFTRSNSILGIMIDNSSELDLTNFSRFENSFDSLIQKDLIEMFSHASTSFSLCMGMLQAFLQTA